MKNSAVSLDIVMEAKENWLESIICTLGSSWGENRKVAGNSHLGSGERRLFFTQKNNFLGHKIRGDQKTLIK
jgi:hypothetical protein